MNANTETGQQTKGLAIVLGGSSGMGKEAAKLLLQDGIEVLVTGRDPEKLKAVAKELSLAGKVETAVVDLYDCISHAHTRAIRYARIRQSRSKRSDTAITGDLPFSHKHAPSIRVCGKVSTTRNRTPASARTRGTTIAPLNRHSILLRLIEARLVV